MGNCAGCGKKLSAFEGYSSDGEEFCKNCFPKRKEIVAKLNSKRELKEKEQKEKDKKQEEVYEKEKEIKKILGKISTKKQKRLILEKAHNLSQKEKDKLITLFDEHNKLETTAWLVFAGILAVAFIFFSGSLLVIGLAFISKIIFWFPVHSKKEKLINELKKIG